MQIVASNDIGRVTISCHHFCRSHPQASPQAETGEGSEETDKHGLRNVFSELATCVLVEF